MKEIKRSSEGARQSHRVTEKDGGPEKAAQTGLMKPGQTRSLLTKRHTALLLVADVPLPRAGGHEINYSSNYGTRNATAAI